MNISVLEQYSLENLYSRAESRALPKGALWGRHLLHLDRPGARRPLSWASMPFAAAPFGGES
ncbi:hypothetical protein [Desulfatibacillum aliphaticivorans]|uniref:hypothetical protein n=1 Tax=Desulfatibacillum aliphaticivorans TaxID=218208 RepID=UPI0004249712|nr:hypothetical protein [Desulfatibacillum aliphaticivorans]